MLWSRSVRNLGMLTSRREFFVFGALQTCLPSTTAAALVTLTVLFSKSISDHCSASISPFRSPEKTARLKRTLSCSGMVLVSV